MPIIAQIVVSLVALILGGGIGSFIAFRFVQARTKASEESFSARLAERDTNLSQLREDREKDRLASESRIEKLRSELQEAIEARAKLDGATESLGALKTQLESKDKEIASQFERITGLSSDLSKYKNAAEEATKAKDDALAAKQVEVNRLISEKETALAAQLTDLRLACQRQIEASEKASDAAIKASQDHCEAQLAEKDRHIEEQKRLLAEAEKKLSETFDSLSVKALTTVSEQFMKTAKATLEAAQVEAKGDLKLKQQAIDELLKPVAESLTKLEKQHAEMEQRRVSAFDSIEKGIKALSQEADVLANALRKPATRGAWGEMNLKVILDNAGLEEGLHYTIQDSTDDEDGGRLRTDVIIHLPNGRDFIIDSKTPLESYWDGMNAIDEATRTLKFSAHARLVRDHVKRLSSKSYWTRYKASPDCVVMFIPTEGAYQAAIESDRSLMMDAHKNRVYLANPMTLVNMIHVTAYVLKEERSRQNANEIQASASELYKRVTKFVGDFADIGRNLRLAVKSYNTAVGALDGRVLPKAREINRLGDGKGSEIDDLPNIEFDPRELTSPESRELPRKAEEVA